MQANRWVLTFRKLSMPMLLAAGLLQGGCAPRVEHRQFSESQVGLAALKEQNVKQVIYGSLVQGYVSRYPIFAETINREILRDLGGYVDRYNVYARETLTYPKTGLVEVDPFLLRSAKAATSVRVATRLMNYVGVRLSHLDDLGRASRASREVYYAMTPEELSLAVKRVREQKGRLTREQQRELAKDIVALVAIGEVAESASGETKGLLVEGENLKTMLISASFRNELQGRSANHFQLLPEIESNLNGSLAGLRAASGDGLAIARNARAWSIYLADAMQ